MQVCRFTFTFALQYIWIWETLNFCKEYCILKKTSLPWMKSDQIQLIENMQVYFYIRNISRQMEENAIIYRQSYNVKSLPFFLVSRPGCMSIFFTCSHSYVHQIFPIASAKESRNKGSTCMQSCRTRTFGMWIKIHVGYWVKIKHSRISARIEN